MKKVIQKTADQTLNAAKGVASSAAGAAGKTIGFARDTAASALGAIGQAGRAIGSGLFPSLVEKPEAGSHAKTPGAAPGIENIPDIDVAPESGSIGITCVDLGVGRTESRSCPDLAARLAFHAAPPMIPSFMKRLLPRPAIGFALAALSMTAFADSRPNILFIYTDDHSHRTISCYEEAYDWVNTPNIDALAKHGVRFRHAYIGTWCMPSRATLLTGHQQYGVESMRMAGKYPGSAYDPDKCPFWPKVFRASGYQTAHIGKWHTGTDTGFGRDWDHQIVWNRPRHTSNAGSYYKDQMIEINGAPAKMVKGYSTDNYTRWALEYLNGKGRQPDKPWYLWLCYGAVHGPFTPAKRHLEAYPDAEVPIPADIYPPREGKPAYLQRPGSWFRGDDGLPHLRGRRRATGELSPGKGLHGSDLNSWIRQYHQGVLALDEAVGRLIQALKETGQYENTLIVFTSDQGFAWGQHGFRSKLAPYDATIRSPLIVSMPSKLPSGEVCGKPVSGPDLIPTFFHFAGIDLPWKMHGRDLTPLLEKPDRTWPHPALMALTGRSYGSATDVVPTDQATLAPSGVPWWVSLRQGRYKYIRNLVEGEIEELYDLEQDPEELTNLALAAKHDRTLRHFRKATFKELRRTDAGFVNRLPKVGTEAARK